MRYDMIRRTDGSSITVERIGNGSNVLCVTFSGSNYNYRNPLLYYTKSLCLQNRFDCVGYDLKYYENAAFRDLGDEDKDTYFENDKTIILESLRSILSSNPYEKLILAGKSLGTDVIRHVIRDKDIVRKSVLLLFTPGLEWNDTIPEIIALENPILIVSSKADTVYMVENLPLLYQGKNGNTELYELDRADHLLETGSVSEDIDILRSVMNRVEAFIGETVSPIRRTDE